MTSMSNSPSEITDILDIDRFGWTETTNGVCFEFSTLVNVGEGAGKRQTFRTVRQKKEFYSNLQYLLFLVLFHQL